VTTFDTDLLVVGAGAAGLVTALTARGRRVSILHAGGTASELAQGGIAAAVGDDDTPQLHAADTRAAGHRCNDDRAVHFACGHALDAIKWLEALGVIFARTHDGRWSVHLEAAHSRARVLHADGDATGAAIMRVLRERLAEAPHVELLPSMRARALLQDTSGIQGVTAVSSAGSPVMVRARDVVLATGGLGGLYSRTTNPLEACGDGLAIALAAGARCDSLAAVQFHPTALDVDTRPLPLISEALRGAGARLIDAAGKYIMHGVHPLGDLAPRDVVASVVYAEQLAGRRVWLDATGLQETDVAHSFPTAYRHCREHGIDPDREPIGVTCAAHYHMGGISVDLDGRTSLPRLWAVGEVACTGLHGRNRLASNSLLEAVTFGRRLGQVLGDARGGPPEVGKLDPLAIHDERIDDELHQLMWRCLGPLRTAASLTEGIATLTTWRARLSRRTDSQAPHLQLVESMLRAAMQDIARLVRSRRIAS